MGSCGSITNYEASLKSGSTAPAFLKVDSTLKTLEIFTNDMSFFGKHELKLTTSPQFYSSSSTLDS